MSVIFQLIMIVLIKQVFMVLLNFSGSFATKSVSLNTEPYMVTPTHIDLNAIEPDYYPFMFSLDKSN